MISEDENYSSIARLGTFMVNQKQRGSLFNTKAMAFGILRGRH